MKVRLKPDKDAKANYAAKFQFHEGPIKTILLIRGCLLLLSFNSMKVRLKLAQGDYCLHTEVGFNSMKVRLKHYGVILNFDA